MDLEQMKKRVAEKRIARTVISRKISYVDQINKIVFSFTERAGCTLSFQNFCDLVGLLDDAKAYHDWIHRYRLDVVTPACPRMRKEHLLRDGYTFVKFVMNPYRRAVSCFHIHHHMPHRSHFTFRTYLQTRIRDPDYFDETDKAHHAQQYEDREEMYVTKYISINKNETYNITKADGTIYTIDPNRFNSRHHIAKSDKDPVQFDWSWPDVAVKQAIQNMPSKYKSFYDPETKRLVEQLYRDDIAMYPFFSFEDDF
jgi:hypothetical protein